MKAFISKKPSKISVFLDKYYNVDRFANGIQRKKNGDLIYTEVSWFKTPRKTYLISQKTSTTLNTITFLEIILTIPLVVFLKFLQLSPWGVLLIFPLFFILTEITGSLKNKFVKNRSKQL